MFKLKKDFTLFVMQIYTFICKSLSNGKKIFSFFSFFVFWCVMYVLWESSL